MTFSMVYTDTIYLVRDVSHRLPRDSVRCQLAELALVCLVRLLKLGAT